MHGQLKNMDNPERIFIEPRTKNKFVTFLLYAEYVHSLGLFFFFKKITFLLTFATTYKQLISRRDNPQTMLSANRTTRKPYNPQTV
jgi:hypothetical protein